MKVGEDNEGEGERQPAVEVTAVAAVAETEADDGYEREQREQAVGADDRRRANPEPARRHRSSRPRKCTSDQIPASETSDEDDGDDERALASAGLRGDERSGRDERGTEEARAEGGPGLDRAEPGLVPGEHGRDGERESPDARREEAGCEQEVHRTSPDEEPGRGEHRHHRGHEGHRRVERDAGHSAARSRRGGP